MEFILALCSYRTYEEWKQCKDYFSVSFSEGSYRTYEEWKLTGY